MFVTGCTNFVSAFVVDSLCRGSEEQILDLFGFSEFLEFLRLVGMHAVGNVAQLLRECMRYHSVSYGCVSNLAKCLLLDV